MKRLLLCICVCLLVLAPAFTQEDQASLGPSGGLGLGFTGSVFSTGYVSLAFLDLRLGGFFQYDFARLGPGSLGAELGAWGFVIPSEISWLVLAEFPALLDYSLAIGGGWTLTAQLGYALYLGMADDYELFHCQVTGLRFSKKHLFWAIAAYIPLISFEGDTIGNFCVWPHLEFGYRF